MHTSQWIFALVVGAFAAGLGGWLMTFDPSGSALLLTGLLVIGSNGYTYLQSRFSGSGAGITDNPANSALT